MAETGYEIQQGFSRIRPDKTKSLAVAHPFFGSKNAKGLRDEIRAVKTVKLREPTLGETLSFAHTAYTNSGEERAFAEAKGIMRDGYFRGFTATHQDPTDPRLDRSLAYIFDFPEFNEDGTVFVDNDKLVARLQAGDKSIRTVPIEEIVGGVFNPSEFARQRYLIELVGGEEQAETAAKLAEAHPSREGYLWKPNFSGKVTNFSGKVTRIAALYSYYDGSRLGVCDGSGLNARGCAVAVFDEEGGRK